MIPELRLLPKDAGNAIGQLAPLLPRCQSKHLCPTHSGVKNSSQHFYGGTFARAIWPNEGEHFTWLKRETNLLDGGAFAVTGRDKRTEATHQSGGAFTGSKGLA